MIVDVAFLSGTDSLQGWLAYMSDLHSKEISHEA
jgi:hypothetical protein